MLLKWQHKNEITLTAFEEQLKFLGNGLLPQPNRLPKTVHQMHKLIGFTLNDFEEHVCINDCCLFPKIKKEDWKNHADEKCSNCNTSRFKLQGVNLAPRKKFYRLPIADQIEGLCKNPRFSESIQKMQAEIGNLSPNDSFWGANLVAEDIHSPDFKDQFCSLIYLSLGLDGVQCFRESNYSLWPIAVKIWNLHPAERTSGEFILVTALIPGFDLSQLILGKQEKLKQKK